MDTILLPELIGIIMEYTSGGPLDWINEDKLIAVNVSENSAASTYIKHGWIQCNAKCYDGWCTTPMIMMVPLQSIDWYAASINPHAYPLLVANLGKIKKQQLCMNPDSQCLSLLKHCELSGDDAINLLRNTNPDANPWLIRVITIFGDRVVQNSLAQASIADNPSDWITPYLSVVANMWYICGNNPGDWSVNLLLAQRSRDPYWKIPPSILENTNEQAGLLASTLDISEMSSKRLSANSSQWALDMLRKWPSNIDGKWLSANENPDALDLFRQHNKEPYYPWLSKNPAAFTGPLKLTSSMS